MALVKPNQEYGDTDSDVQDNSRRLSRISLTTVHIDCQLSSLRSTHDGDPTFRELFCST